MIERLWATTSCSSRAIRARSSATASLRLLLALVLELDGARGERGRELLAAAHDGRRAPDGEHDPADEEDVADDVLADRDRHRERRTTAMIAAAIRPSRRLV